MGGEGLKLHAFLKSEKFLKAEEHRVKVKMDLR
jgi:hypothetical protein